MTIYTFAGFARGDLTISGPDPFSSDATRNILSFGNTTFTLNRGAGWTDFNVSDDETNLHDADSSQDLATAVVFNGNYYSVGTSVEIEYSYVVRAVGTEDYTTIYALELNGDVQGFVSDGGLQPGVTYEIEAGGSDEPSVSYDRLVVCFTPGTAIATPHGPRAVETLREGDLVETLDNGPQPVAWVGRQVARGHGAKTPVRVAAGVLGNRRDLLLSQQHRVLIPPHLAALAGLSEDHLMPVKALIGQPGIARMPHLRVHYHHVLFDRHQVIWADGAAVESLYPGPMAIRALCPQDRARLQSLFPELTDGADWSPARRLLRPGQWQRLLRQRGHAALAA